MFTWDRIRDTLHLEHLDTYLFRGHSLSLGLKRVFGGQVLAQSLNAAYRSVDEGKVPHSLHGYFLRPGDVSRPIIYEVDPIRKGRSFSTRRVVARQNGEAIFNASISFHRIESGPSHQFDLPADIPRPDKLLPDSDHVELLCKTLPETEANRLRFYYLIFPKEVIDLRSPGLKDIIDPKPRDPVSGFWFRITAPVGDNPVMHLTLLTYISDKALMTTGMRPHAAQFTRGQYMGASLDHAMWFHDDVNLRDWTYYHLDSPRSGRARTFNRGAFYCEDGRLIASSSQEGLFRKIDPDYRKSA
ncbi:MAG: acyl-CoA thioesterase II [Hyphomonadaceae bacterium]|nr:acyl-CoA thioesterase II [Hyphomonadaceae bacterium]MBC6411796.1 acyl-CoA thioesterase II [Hyphomonadaceae bacterium]